MGHTVAASEIQPGGPARNRIDQGKHRLSCVPGRILEARDVTGTTTPSDSITMGADRREDRRRLVPRHPPGGDHPSPQGTARSVTTATHEKQISKVPPWVLLGVGGLLVFGGLFTISLAAVWDELTPGIALFFGGLAFIGVLLVVVSIPERRRAEDWDNWKVPAQQIAEIHAFLLSRL